jgi:hypothetical protein
MTNEDLTAYPSVSILIPTDKRYPQFKDEREKMKSLLKQTELTLLKDFPSKNTKPLIKDMYKLAETIDYKNLSDGLGLYISPYREKIFHFPFPVKEKVIIDKTFEFRDLLFAAKNNFNYTVITISENKVRVFTGVNNMLLEEEIPEMPFNMDDVGGKGFSRVGSFTSFSSAKNVSDQKDHAEKKMEQYLLEIDHVISSNNILKNSPLIVCSSQRMIGHYKTITKNAKHILGFVQGNFDNSNNKILYSRIENIIKKRIVDAQKEAMNKLEEAIGSRKAALGICDVWKAAYNKTGRLLLVEKNYSCPATTGKKKPDVLIKDDPDKNDIHYMNDAVDDTIELVLKYGGDVVFVDDGALDEQGKIALITYY